MEQTDENYVDYANDSLEIITNHEIDRLSNLLMGVENASKLCESSGSMVIAEFGFRGGLESVTEQLTALIDRYATEGITDSDRPRLIDNEIKLNKWFSDESSTNEHYNTKLREAHHAGIWEGEDGVHNIMIKKATRRELLHEKKECICFSN